MTDPERTVAVVAASVAQVPAETRRTHKMGLVTVPLSLLFISGLICPVGVSWSWSPMLWSWSLTSPRLWEQSRERTRAGKVARWW